MGYLQTRPGVLIVSSASLNLVSHVPRVPTAGSGNTHEYSCYVGLMCGKEQEGMSGMSVSCGHPTLLYQQMQVCVCVGVNLGVCVWLLWVRHEQKSCVAWTCVWRGPREQIFLYRREYVLVRCTFKYVYHSVSAGVSSTDLCSNMGTSPSAPLTGQSSHLGLPHDDPAHLPGSEPRLPLGLCLGGLCGWCLGPSGTKTPYPSSPLPTCCQLNSLACPRRHGRDSGPSDFTVPWERKCQLIH